MDDTPRETVAPQDLEEALRPLRTENFENGGKQFQGKHWSWSWWLPSESVFVLEHGNVWENCGILGRSGAVWLLASSGQHIAVLSYSEECRK